MALFRSRSALVVILQRQQLDAINNLSSLVYWRLCERPWKLMKQLMCVVIFMAASICQKHNSLFLYREQIKNDFQPILLTFAQNNSPKLTSLMRTSGAFLGRVVVYTQSLSHIITGPVLFSIYSNFVATTTGNKIMAAPPATRWLFHFATFAVHNVHNVSYRCQDLQAPSEFCPNVHSLNIWSVRVNIIGKRRHATRHISEIQFI